MTPSDTAHPEGEREAAIKLAEALEDIAHGRYPPVRPVDGKCAHGRLTTDDCERCIEKHAKDALTAYRQSPQPPAVARPQGEEGLARHRFWGAGEPDCPKDIKAGNGELHTLRCKVCELDNPRNDGCGGAGVPDDVARLVVAARIVAHEDQGKEALNELDQASEAFASRIRWDDEPEEPALSNQGKPSS